MSLLQKGNIRLAVTAIVLAGSALVTAISNYEGTGPKVEGGYKPYKDIVQVVTVCRGHTGRDIIWHKVYSEQECNDLLTKDIQDHGKGVLSCISVPLAQTEYDAFTSLAFNIGIWNFCHSTLVRELNKGHYIEACKQILRWDKAGKPPKTVRGLTVRRKNEYAQCTVPVTQQTVTTTTTRVTK